MKLIAVEANIGVGKSTLLPELAKHLGFEQIQEPVDDPEFTRLLKDFTNNPNDPDKRIKFQKYITESRAKLVEGLDPNGKYLIERSLFSDLVFCQTNFLSMERPSAEYMDYYYDIKRRLDEYPQVDILVYLRCTPEASYKRMLGRGRDAECGTPFEYIQDLHLFHDACLPQICREYNVDMITFDWTKFGSPKLVATKLQEMLDDL